MPALSSSSPKTALVVGAAGGIGSAVARALLDRGWRVGAFARNPARAAKTAPMPGARWITGDAMDANALAAAAEGADLIVHAANPPLYRDWDKLILPMMQNVIGAARGCGARILLPGTVYNYGPDVGVLVAEGAPEHPQTRKGALRVAMERRLKASGVRALIVRAGDVFGPGMTANSWFRHLVKPGVRVDRVRYPGDRSVGHAWAYLPDLGRAMALLAEREADLKTVETFHFAGHYFDQGGGIAEAILRVAELSDTPIRRFPWLTLAAAALFVATPREVLEMRPLWRRPLRLDNAKLVGLLGEEPHTPTDRAVAETLDSVGCLPADWPLTFPAAA
jgi:nucleoside-diphosphate-sugar epimerase